MKKTHKTKSITCRIVSTGTVMQVNTIDEILSPGHYKIDACGVTASDGFPDGVDGECLSAYLEVSDTNHSVDNLKSAAVGQTLTYTNADGDTAVYHRSGTNKNNRVEWSAWSDTAAVGLQNGSITSEKLSKDIRTKIDSPLRPLFVAAGAEYNDSGADKTKTAPWGETVTHKAEHYYLNGLGDITEEEMMDIYNAPCNAFFPFAYKNTAARTVFMRGTGGQTSISSQLNGWFNFSNVEVLGNNELLYCQNTSLVRAFSGCRRVKYILFEPFSCLNCDVRYLFADCISLVHVKLSSLNKDVSFENSASLSKESVLHAIQYAAPTASITISLHPDTYSRVANDSDVVAALSEQPLVNLVSA